MTRRLNLLLLAVVLLVGIPYYWLMLETSPGDAEPHPVTIGELRALASAKPGPAPSRVEVDLVGYRLLPGNLIVAGSGMKRRLLGLLAISLPVPGGKPVIVDPGLWVGGNSGIRMDHYDRKVIDRVAASMRSAGLVVKLHSESSGGKSVALTPGPVALAPGIVAIPAPSHGPGTRMLFVRLASGAEYLFAGDVAPMAQSWKELRNRPRLVTDYWFPEDRRRVFDWLLTIRNLKAQAPALHIVPGYDLEWLAAPESQSGVLVRNPDRRSSPGQQAASLGEGHSLWSVQIAGLENS